MIQEQFKAAFRSQNAQIRQLKQALASAHAQTVSVRKKWSEIFDDVYREANAGKFALRKEITRLKERVLCAERQRDAALDELRDVKKEKNREIYELKVALYEAEQKIEGLTARIHKDYTKSSKSSSQSPDHKAIPNGREKSGRKPGGQKGHIHHGRRQLEPTETIDIPAPPACTDNPGFKQTGRTIRKQLEKLHAAFPEGLKEEVTYDGTAKAFAYFRRKT